MSYPIIITIAFWIVFLLFIISLTKELKEDIRLKKDLRIKTKKVLVFDLLCDNCIKNHCKCHDEVIEIVLDKPKVRR